MVLFFALLIILHDHAIDRNRPVFVHILHHPQPMNLQISRGMLRLNSLPRAHNHGGSAVLNQRRQRGCHLWVVSLEGGERGQKRHAAVEQTVGGAVQTGEEERGGEGGGGVR